MRIRRSILLVLLVITLGSCHRRGLSETEDTLQLDYPSTISVVHRAEWGWQPSEKTLPHHEIKKITVHHSGEMFPPDKNVGAIRN